MGFKFEKVSEQEFTRATNGAGCYGEVRLPKRATAGSAGYDFFSPVTGTLWSGDTAVIPTGIKCKLEPGTVLQIYPRSSWGIKRGIQLANSVGIIDADYYNNESNEGHIMIALKNTSHTNREIKAGDAIAQGIVMRFEVVDDDDTTAERTGGIGSTDGAE